ncbi:translation initiation factor IF-2 [Patescibacteria group bacterium]
MSAKQKENFRPPIVTVLGHVDHGKTTLLDHIRQTKIADREAGGITQGIGASVVSTKEGDDITFIDTPGHAVFSGMRSSGATASDIVVLVVASDDGVKPQTKEAIKYINEVGMPYLVAATKSDLPTADLAKVKSDLSAEGVKFDGEGGDVPIVSVSGKTGDGIDKLLATIRLLWEVNISEKDEFGAHVIESIKSKQGVLASVVVKSGTMRVGNTLYVDGDQFKVRGLTNAFGKPIKEVGAGYPAQVIGMSVLPKVGAQIIDKQFQTPQKSVENKRRDVNIDEGEFPVIIKAKTQGGLNALSGNLPENVVIIDKSVGNVTDSDVFMAKSVGATIIVFESRLPNSVKKLATAEKIEIKVFRIVYEIFEYLEKRVKQGQTQILGTAEILAEFPFNKRRVAGVKVTSGKIEKNHKLIVLRDGEELGETKMASLKREKKDVDSAIQGQEAGIIFDPYLDFSVGDMIVSFKSLR